MRLFAAWLMAMLALISSAVAEVPYLDYGIDFQAQGNQFHVQSKVRNTPLLRFLPKLTTNAFAGAGYSYVFRFAKNDSADAMSSITGAWNSTSGKIEFYVSTNDFARPVASWYAAIVAMSGTVAISYAPGLITIGRSPEIDTPGVLATLTAISGSGYGPFTGSFVGWPFPVESGSISQFTGETTSPGLVWQSTTNGIGRWGPAVTATGAVSYISPSNGISGGGDGAVGLQLDTNFVKQLAGVTNEPLFDASPALGITSNNILQWNGAISTNTTGTVNGTTIADGSISTNDLDTNVIGRIAKGVIAWGWGNWSTATFNADSDLYGAIPSGNLRTNSVSTTELDTNVNARLSDASAAFAWGSWSQGIYGAVASDLYLGSNGYPQIRTGVVTTVEILDETIANADIATNAAISASKISGTALTQSTTLTGDVAGVWNALELQSSVVGSNELVNGGVHNADLALNSVSSANIINNTIVGADIVSGTISNTQLASSIIASSQIIDGTITNADIATNAAISPSKIVGTALTEFTLFDGAVMGERSELYMPTNAVASSNIANFTIMAEDLNTNVTDNIGAAVTTTSTAPQRVQTDFIAGDSLWSATNLWLGSTNGSLSTNMLVNGNFTGDTAWVMTGGAAWNSGSTGILTFSAGTAGTVIQSNRFAASPGTWIFRYVCLVPPATGSLVASFGGDSFYQTGNLTGRVEYVFTPDTTDTFSFAGNSTNGLISVDEFQLFQMYTGDGGVAGNWSVGGKLSASNGVFSGTISGNATGYLPLATGGSVLGRINMVDVGIELRDGTSTNVLEGNDTNVTINGGTAWHSLNDGAGSGLDADLLDGKSSTGFVSNLPGVTLPAMDASALTNLPAATSTNSVSGVKVSEATNIYVGTVPLNSSATIQFSATATGPTASVLSGALTGINGAGVTGPIALASLVNVVQTGQVNQATNLPLAAAVLVLATSDGGTTTFYKADASGTIAFTNAPLAAAAMVVASTDGGTNLFLKTESAGGSGATQAIATVGSSTVTSTISGATLSWSNAATAGGSGGYTAIPTNPHGFRVMYVFNSATNFSTFEGTKLILMTNAANVVYDTGIADGFGRPYWNTTNSTWSSPKGKSRVTHFADAQQGAVLIEGIGWNDSRTATNAFGANPAFEDKFAVWNILAPGALYGGIRGPYSRIWESPGATNTYYIFGRCASACYNLYGSDLTVEILTVEP